MKQTAGHLLNWARQAACPAKTGPARIAYGFNDSTSILPHIIFWPIDLIAKFVLYNVE
jgi:hypothetical protein